MLGFVNCYKLTQGHSPTHTTWLKIYRQAGLTPATCAEVTCAARPERHVTSRYPEQVTNTAAPGVVSTGGFVAIDRGVRYRISGVRATRERNTGTNNYPTAPNASDNVTNDYSASVLIGDLSPWRQAAPGVGHIQLHSLMSADQSKGAFL